MKANILNNVGKPPDKLAILCYSGASWESMTVRLSSGPFRTMG